MIAKPAVFLIDPKYPHNVAAAIRACSCFGADVLRFTGTRVTKDSASGGGRLPREERMKGYRDVSWEHDERPFKHVGSGAFVVPVCVELTPDSEPLDTFVHPESAIYVFGPEDGHVPRAIRGLCHRFVHIPAHHCLNLAAAVNVILYDRLAKLRSDGTEPRLPIGEMLHEKRGVIEIPGWDGK